MNLQEKLNSAINSLRICEKFPGGIRSDEIKQIADELETILAELGRGAGVPEGWALVPIEPNWDMRNEGRELALPYSQATKPVGGL